MSPRHGIVSSELFFQFLLRSLLQVSPRNFRVYISDE